ncbi:MAG: FAD-dependent oxidoreductase [Thermocladium sp.]
MVKEVLYSARTGDERRFICCEWWCEGYWLSLGELNQCLGESSKPRLPFLMRFKFIKKMAAPGRFPRNKWVIRFWGLASGLATNMNHLDITALPEPPKAVVKEVTGDALVIGGGLAGLSTAAELSRAGFKVTIIEGNQDLGGRNALDTEKLVNGSTPANLISDLRKSLLNDPNVSIYGGYAFDGKLEDAVIAHALNGSAILKLRHRYVVFATGAREVPAVFPGNGSIKMYTGWTYLNLARAGSINHKSVAVYGSDDWGIRVAHIIKSMGINVVLLDNSVQIRSDLYRDLAKEMKVETTVSLNPNKLSQLGVDALVTTVRVPAIDAAVQWGGEAYYEHELGGMIPRHSWSGEVMGTTDAYVVGEASGLIPLHLVPMQAKVVASSIALKEGRIDEKELEKALAEFRTSINVASPKQFNAFQRLDKGLHEIGIFVEPNVINVPQWASDMDIADADEELICMCEDVTLGDLLENVKAFTGAKEIKVTVLHDETLEARKFSPPPMERIKRTTGLGTGACQGKLCMVTANLILARIFQKKPREIGIFRQRFPLNPMPMGTAGDASE